jgi:hypothetical protein
MSYTVFYEKICAWQVFIHNMKCKKVVDKVSWLTKIMPIQAEKVERGPGTWNLVYKMVQ